MQQFLCQDLQKLPFQTAFCVKNGFSYILVVVFDGLHIAITVMHLPPGVRLTFRTRKQKVGKESQR